MNPRCLTGRQVSRGSSTARAGTLATGTASATAETWGHGGLAEPRGDANRSAPPPLRSAHDRDQLAEGPLLLEILPPRHPERRPYGRRCPLDRASHRRFDFFFLSRYMHPDDVPDLQALNLEVDRHRSSVDPGPPLRRGIILTGWCRASSLWRGLEGGAAGPARVSTHRRVARGTAGRTARFSRRDF